MHALIITCEMEVLDFYLSINAYYKLLKLKGVE